MLLAKEGEHLRNRIDEQLVLTTEKKFYSFDATTDLECL